MEIRPVAYIHTDFPTKFGLPRQSGLVEGLKGEIVFEPYYRNPEGVKGLDGFSHLWLLWDFSLAHREDWSATAKPPRLGGRTHMGVWATRSPFRPNSIGLSSVRLDRIEMTADRGPVLHVSGIDMMDGTPIYDIKPYISLYDSHPDARNGFVSETPFQELIVTDPDELIKKSALTAEQQEALYEVLRADPRPRYDADNDGKRRYGFYYCDYDVRFYVRGNMLEVAELVPQAH
ncbi:MAG: tRNA (N6-threonylcarbamoyladenosine(37)-N6)-methyltransferase TrmO [Lachnospiraceae bacterium]|nr:tRNA (N6-threonylcarbamoyladenosine(37)-N6)-methyltransferase TrmO [Lachnospiraceae bacterium]